MNVKKVTDMGAQNVSFSPLKEHYLASCYANGVVDIWDLRRNNQEVLKIHAHIGNV
jgi:WD40 repeat protein